MPVLFVACLLSTILFPIIQGWTRCRGYLDAPDQKRKRQPFPVPLGGGIVIGISTLAAVGGHPDLPWSFLTSFVLIGMVGWMDDRKAFRPLAKSLAQLIALTPLLISTGGIQNLSLGSTSIELGLWGVPLMAFWFLLVINAFNFLDGIDGLCTCIGLSSLIGLSFSGNLSGVEQLLCLAFAGSLIGLLPNNLPAARMYLGDCGSLMIGFTLAYLTTLEGTSGSGEFDPVRSLGFIALPALDLSLAILRRLLLGKPIWEGDREHVHHVLLRQTRSVWGTLFRLVLVAVVFQTTVPYLFWASPILLGLLIGIRWIGHQEYFLLLQFLEQKLFRGRLVILRQNEGALSIPGHRASERVHWEHAPSAAGVYPRSVNLNGLFADKSWTSREVEPSAPP